MSLTRNGLSNIHGKIFEVIRGVEGDCLVLGDENSGDRIAGPKPWGGGQIVKQFRTDEEYGPIEYLESENEKLRKYVRELLRVVRIGEVDCGACNHFDECYAGDAMDFAPENCRLVVYARELGIKES